MNTITPCYNVKVEKTRDLSRNSRVIELFRLN